MVQLWQTRLTLNVILGYFERESSVPSKLKISYTPIVSDVSDDDLMETVKQLEKSENVIGPTPLAAHSMPFNVFKTTRGGDHVPLEKQSNLPISTSLTLSDHLRL